MKTAHPITFNIYASCEEEAERGRMAFVSFINEMGKQGAMVSGDKLEEAAKKLNNNAFAKMQAANFFKANSSN